LQPVHPVQPFLPYLPHRSQPHTKRAEQLLDSAGFPHGANGIRFRFTLKTSTEEQARVVGAALQEQRVGIDPELRPLELATLLSDASRGNFQTPAGSAPTTTQTFSNSPFPASVFHPTAPIADTTAIAHRLAHRANSRGVKSGNTQGRL